MHTYEYIGKRHKMASNLYYWRSRLKQAIDINDSNQIAYFSLELHKRQLELDAFTKAYKDKVTSISRRGRKAKHVPDVLKVNEQYVVEPVDFSLSFD